VASVSLPQSPPRIKDADAQNRVRFTAIVFCLTLGGEILLGWKPRNPTDFADPWIATGTAALLLGLLVRTWAAGMLVKKKRLASDGPYALVRHPLYLGSILMMFGVTLLTGMWWNLLIAGITALISFGGAIRGEEQFLAAKFGERWTAYATCRGRLLPRGIGGSVLAFWNWKRWLKNREFNAWMGAILGWLGLLAWYLA